MLDKGQQYDGVGNVEARVEGCEGEGELCSGGDVDHRVETHEAAGEVDTQMTPKTLKKRWPKAARRASVLAVSVVPMFSPSTRAMPRYMGSPAWVHSIMVMAMRAAEL